jgi:hypothetical protein
LFVPATNFIEKSTNENSETRRYIDEDHFQAYLKKMKDDAEKVGVIYTIYPPISIQKLDQWLGIWSHFFDELIANILG